MSGLSSNARPILSTCTGAGMPASTRESVTGRPRWRRTLLSLRLSDAMTTAPERSSPAAHSYASVSSVLLYKVTFCPSHSLMPSRYLTVAPHIVSTLLTTPLTSLSGTVTSMTSLSVRGFTPPLRSLSSSASHASTLPAGILQLTSARSSRRLEIPLRSLSS